MWPRNTFVGTSAVALRGDAGVFDPPPSSIAAGFDSVLQFSNILLHRTLAANLSRRGLNILSVRVPYASDLVSPAVRELVRPHIQSIDPAIGSSFLEVQVLNPRPTRLRWPTPPDSVAAPTGAANTIVSANIARRREVEIVWSIQLNLFQRSTLDTTVGAIDPARAGGGSGSSPATDLGGSAGYPGAADDIFANPNTPPPPPPKGSRVALAVGTATMQTPTNLLLSTAVYQFRIALDFQAVQPTYGSTDPAMVEFLQTDLATSMLAQAIAPLRSASVGLTPTMALVGNLTPSQVAQLGLSALNVHDMVVEDDAGQVLTLCVTLGSETQGAFSLVRSFLVGQHFAYYASDKVFGPMLKGLWRANAVHTPVVSEVPVEMLVEEGSNETGTGKARVKVTLSDTLTDGAIVATTDPDLGDPLRIVSEQTVELLGLWDPSGRRIRDLGELARPTIQPFTFSLQMFERPASVGHTVQPPFQNLFSAMFLPLYFPMIERYQVRRASGFTSSPLRAIVVRWSLPSLFDDEVVGTIWGTATLG
jgi:hypothetical protein